MLDHSLLKREALSSQRCRIAATSSPVLLHCLRRAATRPHPCVCTATASQAAEQLGTSNSSSSTQQQPQRSQQPGASTSGRQAPTPTQPKRRTTDSAARKQLSAPKAEQQQDSSKASPTETSKPSKQQTDYALVDTPAALLDMLEELKAVDCIGLDCEGLKLGDKEGGKLSLMQISASKKKAKQTAPLRIWLVDVTVLAWRSIHYSTSRDNSNSQQGNNNKGEGSKVADSPPPAALCLKQLLESGSVTKLMYDVRSDSSQLFHEYGVRLRGVYDLQLAEVAHRQLQLIPTGFVLPLAKTLEKYIKRLPAFEKDMLNSVDVARTYHYSNKTEIWEERPIADELQEYAACDVRYLHALAAAINKKLPREVVGMVRKATAQRIRFPSPPGAERAAAPSILKKSDVRRLFKPRAQQQQEAAQAAGSDGSTLHTLHGLRVQLAGMAEHMRASDASVGEGEQQQGVSELCQGVAAAVATLDRAMAAEVQQQQQLQRDQQQQSQQQPQSQAQEGVTSSKELLLQAVAQLSACLQPHESLLEPQSSTTIEAEQRPQQQQQQEQQQPSQSSMQRWLRDVLQVRAGLDGVANGTLLSQSQSVSSSEAVEAAGVSSVDEEEVRAREPPRLLVPVHMEEQQQQEGVSVTGQQGVGAVSAGEAPAAASSGKPFILKPRKRLPGEPEPSWLLQQAEEESSVQGEGSSGESEEKSSTQQADVHEGAEASVQGSGEGASGDASNSESRRAASPYLLWAPAAPKQADAQQQTQVKRPLLRPKPPPSS